MRIRQSDPMSIEKLVSDIRLRISLRIFFTFFVILLSIASIASINYQLQSTENTYNASAPYLSQLVAGNDFLEATRYLDSMMAVQTISGYAIVDVRHKTISVFNTPIRYEDALRHLGTKRIVPSSRGVDYEVIDSLTPGYILLLRREISFIPLILSLVLASFVCLALYLMLRFEMKALYEKISQPISLMADRIRTLPSDQPQLQRTFDSFASFAELTTIENAFGDALSRVGDYQIQLREMEKTAAVARLTQMLAHDVRKPFSLLEVVFKLLRQAKNLSEVRSILEDTVPEVEQAYALTNGLINDVMEMNRQQKPIQKEEAIELIIQSVLEESFRIHDKVELKLEYRFNHKHLLLIEAQKIRRVYANIVGNAVEAIKKYGGDTLWFSVEETIVDGKPMAKLSIGNNGPGIPEEHLDQLFESFFSKKEGGTGLGLAIAKKVVVDHGGTIWCESGAQVHKVEFVFTLPLSDRYVEQKFLLPTSSSEVIAAQRRAVVAEARSHGSVIEDPRQAEAEEKIAATVANLGRKLKIAVLDDDEIYRAGIKGLVDESATLAKSIELVMFANGNDLLQQSASFDGYICDVDLGAGSPNGYTVTATLRTHGILGGICIHSNRTLKEDMESSFQVGADQCLPKPMSRAHLVTFVNAFVLERMQFQQEVAPKPQELPRKPRIIVLDDSPVFLQAWILRLTDAAVESYRKPEVFLDEIEKNPRFLDDATAIITDNHFDKVDSRYTGLQLGEYLKSRGVTVPLYLCSNGDYTDAELAGKVDFMVEKSPCS